MTLQFKNIEQLTAELSKDSDYQNGDVHQALLNIQYAKWQKGQFKSYDHMIEETSKQYGELHAFAIAFGKYNQQVGNGGHHQYYYNGLASYENRGCFGDYEGDTSFHRDYVVSLLGKLDELKSAPWYEELNNIVCDFKIEVDMERYAEEEYYDEDEGEFVTEEIDNPEYGEVENTYELDLLDTRLYKIANDVMKDLNQFFLNKLTETVASL